MAGDTSGRIRLRVRGLENGAHPVEVSVSAEVLDFPAFSDTAKVLGHLIREDDNIRIELTAKANGQFECARCLEQYQQMVLTTLDQSYIPALPKELSAEEVEDILVFDPARGLDLDITEDVRAALILAIPMKPLCRVDCAGICPTCGKDLNKGECACIEEDETAPFTALKGLHERLRADEIRGTPGSTG